jgi:hypothetical protein
MANPQAQAFDQDIREQAGQHTLSANPLVGVRGYDIIDSARVLLGRMLASPRVTTELCLSLVGELGRIGTGSSEIAPDPRDKRLPIRPGRRALPIGRWHRLIWRGRVRSISSWTRPVWISAMQSARVLSYR